MWTQERHHRIMTLLLSGGRLRTDTLAQTFGVSRETVRRDLLELEAAGHLRRVHGGAVAPDATPEVPFQQRARSQQHEKAQIARAAAELIRPGQTCFIDAGTTTLAFAQELAQIEGVRVITNSLDIARALNGRRTRDVILLGGHMISDVPATYGELTLSTIERFVVDIAIISPVSIHPQHGLMNYEIHEAELARAMIDRASKAIALADHTKLGVPSRVVICDLQKIDVLVTDSQAAEEALSEIRDGGVGEIIRAA
jgi:DeoR family transcriptional regulator, fructose operon transcriptional repressor